MIEIINKENSVSVVFNEHAETFSASKMILDKGAGNRLLLSPGKDYIHIIYAAGAALVEIIAPENFAFDSGGGVPFATMEALYERLAIYLEDRTGAI